MRWEGRAVCSGGGGGGGHRRLLMTRVFFSVGVGGILILMGSPDDKERTIYMYISGFLL